MALELEPQDPQGWGLVSWPTVFIVVAIKETCKWHSQWHLSPHSRHSALTPTCVSRSPKDNALGVWLMLTWWWLSCRIPRSPVCVLIDGWSVCVCLWGRGRCDGGTIKKKATSLGGQSAGLISLLGRTSQSSANVIQLEKKILHQNKMKYS